MLSRSPASLRLRRRGDIPAIKAATEELTQASHKMAEQMYQQSGGAEGAAAADGPDAGPTAPPAADGDSQVVDAEFEESN